MQFPLRRSLAAALVAGVALLGCDDSTDPNIDVPIVLLVQHPSLDGGTGAGTLQLAKARVIVRAADDNEVIADTLITISATSAQRGTRYIAAQTTGSAGQIRIELDVEIPRDAAGEGEDLLITVELQDAAGVVQFRAGPIALTVDPDDPPDPVSTQIDYVGTGSAATSVSITPGSPSVAPGGSFDFTATAKDAAGNTLAGTPVVWTSLNPEIATIPDRAVGHAVAGTTRGVATIRASLITGQNAQATLTVQPAATTIAAQSGNNQSAAVTTTLAPFVVKVTAADGVGVSGVPVTFAITAGTGGSLSAQTATTDASGIASSTLTLGTGVGGFTVTATVAGLAGSPVAFSATATSGAATVLAFNSQPTNVVSGAVLPAIVVEIRDAQGNRVSSFTGAVSLVLDAPPAGVSLGGTTTVNAVGGLATFSTITVNAGATGLRLRASAAGVSATALSNAFNVTSGVATRLAIAQQPTALAFGQTLRFVIEARTASGALATGYNATIVVALTDKPLGGGVSNVVSAGFVNGVATVDLLVTAAGSYTFSFRSTTLDEVLTTPILIAAVTFELVSGNSQSGPANQALAQNLVARVVDGSNAPVAGIAVTWSIVSGGGTITVVTGVSDANGLVSARWTLGPNGAQSAQVAVANSAFTFTATIGT